MPRDVVALRAGGQEFTGWTGISIGMAIDQVADTFSLSLPYDPARSDLRQVFRPFGYERVEVRLDDELLITGRVDKVSASVGAGERMLTVEGRSLTAALVDCSHADKPEYSALFLSTIAKQACKPFGLLVRADADSRAAIEIARPEYGQTPADFLGSLAAPRNLLLNSSYDGKLVISSATAITKRAAVAALVEGEQPLLNVSASFDGSRRFSLYRVATQFAGASDKAGEAADSGVPIYRPRFSAVADADSDSATETGLTATARRARTAGYASAVAVSCTLAGWRRPDGARWAERQAVTLKAPGAMLPTEARYIIAGCTLKLEEGGQTTDLRLVLPELYAGQMPEAEPWE